MLQLQLQLGWAWGYLHERQACCGRSMCQTSPRSWINDDKAGSLRRLSRPEIKQARFSENIPLLIMFTLLRASGSRIIIIVQLVSRTLQAPQEQPPLEHSHCPSDWNGSKLDQVQDAAAGITRCNPPLLAEFLRIFGIS